MARLIFVLKEDFDRERIPPAYWRHEVVFAHDEVAPEGLGDIVRLAAKVVRLLENPEEDAVVLNCPPEVAAIVMASLWLTNRKAITFLASDPKRGYRQYVLSLRGLVDALEWAAGSLELSVGLIEHEEDST